ncbi:hypothetical protein [Streptomyces sp. TRM64462]|uniref:hypothetical protein n=1 Tax=Streptomyces sp. TRM64462 TaxID=2741726 RepID=UPI001586F815|nr:hypothetical protein [Streptomyces sp. TRM64462]
MYPDLAPIVAATTQWLTRAYPAGGGAVDRALAEAQARQAVSLAAALRYPTELDAALVAVTGAGGADRLDWITGADSAGDPAPWRTWVDETVASWAACLLGSPELAAAAVAAVPDGAEFRRLLVPGDRDHRAAALLRHPDLLAPVAGLHRAELLALLSLTGSEDATPAA